MEREYYDTAGTNGTEEDHQSQSLHDSGALSHGQSSVFQFTSTTSSGVQPTISTTPALPTSVPRIKRRNRMITSCLECRRRKLKCNKSHPCTNCVKFTRDCVFLAPALDQASQLKLTEIKEKVGSLERLLERDVARNPASSGTAITSQESTHLDDADECLPPEEEKDLKLTHLAVQDAAYDFDGDDDDLLDLGIQLGKMRITERIGGFFRPKISQEINDELEQKNTDTLSRQNYNGKSPSPQLSQLPPASEWLKPGPAYIMPSSGFFFGIGSNPGSLIDFLPSRLAADRLIKQYFDAVHPICQILHRQSFEKEYDTFWDEVTLGIEPPSSVQTIVFAAMFSGVVSMDESAIIRDFGVSKSSLMENCKLGTETALTRANFLRTTKVQTLQAFVMYLIPLCRSELSRAHSVLVGAAIRMAECMGLHRDGETYGMNPLETHVRRLIWYQLSFLDIRTCEAQGPRPSIRREEYDTKLPINSDDVDFHNSGPAPVAADRWTDATFCLMRFEFNEMMRSIWIDRPRIERRKISLTAVLSKIETFKTNMAAKYDHLMDERIPIQKCAKILKDLLVSRLHVMLLFRYTNTDQSKSSMPERLKNVVLGAGATTIEMAVRLETSPDLKPWAWYSGAYNQYHTAFLLLMKVHGSPEIKEADRIWASLDYIYECNPSEPRHVKSTKILTELRHKTAVYQSLRGMRAPVSMDNHYAERASKVSESSLSKHSTAVSPTPTSSFPRFPGPSFQFAGVANGESLWAAPPSQSSPETMSDTNSYQELPRQGPALMAGQDDLMADIDWDAFDALFPPEPQSGFLSIDQPIGGEFQY